MKIIHPAIAKREGNRIPLSDFPFLCPCRSVSFPVSGRHRPGCSSASSPCTCSHRPAQQVLQVLGAGLPYPADGRIHAVFLHLAAQLLGLAGKILVAHIQQDHHELVTAHPVGVLGKMPAMVPAARTISSSPRGGPARHSPFSGRSGRCRWHRSADPAPACRLPAARCIGCGCTGR